MRLSQIFATMVVAVLATTPLAASAQISCHLLSSATPTPPQYGAAYNLFSTDNEVLLNVGCDLPETTLTVGNGQPTLYVYRIGYEWVADDWQPIVFNGPQREGDWFIGTASTKLVRSDADLVADNFVTAFICQWIDDGWKCGCADHQCQNSMWQLQSFRVGDSAIEEMRRDRDGSSDEAPSMDMGEGTAGDGDASGEDGTTIHDGGSGEHWSDGTSWDDGTGWID